MFTASPIHPLATMHPSVLRYGAGPVPDRLHIACLYVPDPGHKMPAGLRRVTVSQHPSTTDAARAAMAACGISDVPMVYPGDVYFPSCACTVDVVCPNVAHAARTWIEITGETPCTPHEMAALLHIARLLV